MKKWSELCSGISCEMIVISPQMRYNKKPKSIFCGTEKFVGYGKWKSRMEEWVGKTGHA